MLYKHKVVSNRRLNEKFHLIKLESLNKIFLFKEGQFVRVKVKKDISRSYSLASSSNKLPYWQIFVDITPGGPGTTYLKNLKKEDIIKTSPASGQFILSKKSETYIFGATGCGIAPLIPMIEKLLTENKKIFLFWGLRYKKDITLETFLNKCRLRGNFYPEIVLSRPESAWRGKEGYITSFILKRVKAFSSDKIAVYLSGSSEFIKETTYALTKERFPVKRIYLEACY